MIIFDCFLNLLFVIKLYVIIINVLIHIMYQYISSEPHSTLVIRVGTIIV